KFSRNLLQNRSSPQNPIPNPPHALRGERLAVEKHLLRSLALLFQILGHVHPHNLARDVSTTILKLSYHIIGDGDCELHGGASQNSEYIGADTVSNEKQRGQFHRNCLRNFSWLVFRILPRDGT